MHNKLQTVKKTKQKIEHIAIQDRIIERKKSVSETERERTISLPFAP